MSSCVSEKGGTLRLGGLGVVERLGARLISHLATFSLVPLEVAAPSSTIVKTSLRHPKYLHDGGTFAVSCARASREVGGCRRGSDTHHEHRASPDRQEGGLGRSARTRTTPRRVCVDLGTKQAFPILRLRGGQECSEVAALCVVWVAKFVERGRYSSSRWWC